MTDTTTTPTEQADSFTDAWPTPHSLSERPTELTVLLTAAEPDLRQRFAAELHRIADDVVRLELPLGTFLTVALGVLDSRADLQRWADYLGTSIDEDGGTRDDIPNIDHPIPLGDREWGPTLTVRAQIQPDQQSEVEPVRARGAELESKTAEATR